MGGGLRGPESGQKIIVEMLGSLNYDADRALCNRMAGLYNFIYRKLVESSTTRQPSPAREALKLLEYQRETWVMLIEKLCRERTAAPAANPAPEAKPSGSFDAAYGALSVQG